jgi:serine/threonine protein kinase
VRRLGDRFVVLGPLGAGGMGSIYRGRDERLGEDVAIKILKRALLEDPIARERFRREARSLAKLRHPGIVTVLDSGEADGDLYTVMELVNGETLEQLMARDGALSIEVASPLFLQVLEALAICHESSIVHRDIKPSNVMVTAGTGGGAGGGGFAAAAPLHVKLIDFGLAHLENKAIEKLTETGTVQGTASYMAPEQCRGEDVGPPSDIYSAGVLFYEMLAGAAPFQGSDAATFMAQHLFVDPTPLRQVAPRISTGVAAAIHAALAKQAGDRPTARALHAALTAAASGIDPEARAERAAVERRDVARLVRSERAVVSRMNEPRSMNERALTTPPMGRVVVWMGVGDRSAALRGCLATGGFACSHAATDEAPDLSASSGERIAVVVSARDGMDRIRRLRSAHPKVPIVAIDVAGPDETTEAIRAGASDMLLREAPDADLGAKLERLLKRRTRA